MIKELSKLMRIALSRGKELIPLRDELEHARAYVNLQKMRYEYGFRVHWDVDEALLMTPIPEDHAAAADRERDHPRGQGDGGRRGDRGHRTHRGRPRGHPRRRQRLPGSRSRLAAPAGEQGEEDDPDRGYGIRNIQQRFRLHFGDKYGLSYEKREGGGLEAKLTLPLHFEPIG